MGHAFCAVASLWSDRPRGARHGVVEDRDAAVRPVTGELIIEVPVGTVFDVAADERNEPRYNVRMVEVEKLTPGPIGTGTRFAAVVRSRGRSIPMTIEYTAFTHPSSLTSISRMPTMVIHGTVTFTAEGGHTRLRWSWHLQPHGLLRLIGPIIRAVGRRQERANWVGLKDYLEAGGAASRQRSDN